MAEKKYLRKSEVQFMEMLERVKNRIPDAMLKDEVLEDYISTISDRLFTGDSTGMDAAATTAASAVAAGIQPGKELTRYLSLTADAAAIAGASMADMGSNINKVQTSQIAYFESCHTATGWI